MGSRIISVVMVLIVVGLVFSTSSGKAVAEAPTYVKGTTLIDVSWPDSNCYAAPSKIRSSAIVGVNGGLNFHNNKCLLSETSRIFSGLSLYANTGYPGQTLALKYKSYPKKCGAGDNRCLAYNWGYNAGVYAVNYADLQGVHSNIWWLDVETDNSWVADTAVNRSSIQGELDAIKHLTLFAKVGIYSYPGQWDAITGSWRNGLPNWVATGSLERSVAISWCENYDFTGGATWITQYTTYLDQDYVCQTH